MKNDLFQELLESVREGGQILRGERSASRKFVIEEPDVASIRKKYRLSQPKFASLLGISTKTLQNWEQHRRKPEGPARVLLQVAARHPEAILDVVSETRATSNRPAASRKVVVARNRKSAARTAKRASPKDSAKSRNTASPSRTRRSPK